MTAGRDAGAEADFPLTPLARRRLSALALFSDQVYLELNPDVARAGFDGLTHAFTHGYREGREIFAPKAIARAYGLAAREVDPPPSPVAPPLRMGSSRDGRVTIFVHSLSDLPARDAAHGLARDLRAAKVPFVLCDETADHLADHGVTVFVAPQDFFAIGSGVLWWDPEILRRAYILSTASTETVEGRGALPAILNARGVIEPSPIWARLWRSAGIETLEAAGPVTMRSRWLEEADRLHPLVLAAPEAARSEKDAIPPWRERPIDLFHFDRDAERRNLFFGRNAAAFARHSTFLYLQQVAIGPVEERMHRRAHARIAGHLARHSRLTLSIADDHFPALDRYRTIHQALAGGSVVVSDVRYVDHTLEAGTHYFHDDPKQIPALIDWLLDEPDGQRAAERAGRAGLDLIAGLNADADRPARIAEFLTASRRFGQGGTA